MELVVAGIAGFVCFVFFFVVVGIGTFWVVVFEGDGGVWWVCVVRMVLPRVASAGVRAVEVGGGWRVAWFCVEVFCYSWLPSELICFCFLSS